MATRSILVSVRFVSVAVCETHGSVSAMRNSEMNPVCSRSRSLMLIYNISTLYTLHILLKDTFSLPLSYESALSPNQLNTYTT